MSKIKIGWSEVDITPKKGQNIGLAGQFFERITNTVESTITVTALTVESDNDYMIMCSCDLAAVGDNLNALVKEKLQAYLPTEKAEKGSHYSAYVSSGYTGHEGGDILVRETLTKINEKF